MNILGILEKMGEMYLDKELRKELDFEIESQKKIKIFKQVNGLENKTAKQDTYPDFICYTKEGKPFIVLDAKFKEKWGEKCYRQEKVDLDDYTKCIRDMNSLGVHATGVIFPTNVEININQEKETLIHGVSEFNQFDHF